MMWIVGALIVALLIHAIWWLSRPSDSDDDSSSGYSCSYCGRDYGCRCLG